MPNHWIIAPASTKKCHRKCATLFFIVKGIIPREYAIPPPTIHKNKPILFPNIRGTNNNALQPKTTYNAKCSFLNFAGPNTPMRVIPVAIIDH